MRVRMFSDPPIVPELAWEGVADLATRRVELTPAERPHAAWIDDPHWTLAALGGADDSAKQGEDFVGGFLSARYSFRADLKQAAVELPPHGSVKRPTITGEAWIDGDGLVRRVVWRQPFRRRPRWPIPAEPETRLWHGLELWDFGVPAG
ncbi:MAG: hypothetical protein ACJ77M_06785 [Thermoleophilaceae bacterium]